MRVGQRVRGAFGQGLVRVDRAGQGGWTRENPRKCWLGQGGQGGQGVFRETAGNFESAGKSASYAENPADFLLYPDHPDHPDQDRKYKGLSGQGGLPNPDQDISHPDQRLPWNDERSWIERWGKAGAPLAKREPVVRAWIAAAPSRLPPGLPAQELRRIARNHGIDVDAELERREVARLLRDAMRALAVEGDEGELRERDEL